MSYSLTSVTPALSFELIFGQSFPVEIYSFHICPRFLAQRLLFSASFLPFRFQVRACFVLQLIDFHNVCPIYPQKRFLIFSSAVSWFVCSHSRLLLMISSQRILSIFRTQSFINTYCPIVEMLSMLYQSLPSHLHQIHLVHQ